MGRPWKEVYTQPTNNKRLKKQTWNIQNFLVCPESTANIWLSQGLGLRGPQGPFSGEPQVFVHLRDICSTPLLHLLKHMEMDVGLVSGSNIGFTGDCSCYKSGEHV